MYDAWGKHIRITDGSGNNVSNNEAHIANINPFRYRGYYFDVETGWYYLNARYYDPNVGRFISPDAAEVLTASPLSLTDKNLYAYCDNNPVVRIDSDGEFWDTLFDVVSLVVSVVDVITNPTDPMAWAGLAADTISLVVPGLTGGGSVVRAMTKADDVVDAVKTIDKVDDALGVVNTVNKVDNTFDAAKMAKKGWKVGDDITSLTRAGNTPSWSTVRQRYWKNEAFYNPSKYPNDLSRMKKGLAPIGDDFFPIELHHTYGRNGENFFIFEPLNRKDHRFLHYGRY